MRVQTAYPGAQGGRYTGQAWAQNVLELRFYVICFSVFEPDANCFLLQLH